MFVLGTKVTDLALKVASYFTVASIHLHGWATGLNGASNCCLCSVYGQGVKVNTYHLNSGLPSVRERLCWCLWRSRG